MKLRPKKVDSHFLVKIIRNEASVEETEYFERWRAESDLNKEEYGNLLLIWEQMGKVDIPESPDPELQWEMISEKLPSEEKPAPQTYNLNRNAARSNWITFAIRAAAVVILSFASIMLYQNIKLSETGISTPVLVNIPTKVKIYELVAEKGQKITFPLSDGSIVYLNSDSKLIYPKYFADDSRELEVIGEAYFSVKPDPNRPFKLKTGEITTIVTGTEFNVSNRNNKVEVVVASGTVKVLSGNFDKFVQLKKGEKVSANSGRINKPITVDLQYELAWRENKLAFSNTPLKEIMDEIERFYNVKIIFKNDSLKSRTLTGVFETRSLEQTLSLLNLTLDLNIHQQGFTVIIE